MRGFSPTSALAALSLVTAWACISAVSTANTAMAQTVEKIMITSSGLGIVVISGQGSRAFGQCGSVNYAIERHAVGITRNATLR